MPRPFFENPYGSDANSPRYVPTRDEAEDGFAVGGLAAPAAAPKDRRADLLVQLASGVSESNRKET